MCIIYLEKRWALNCPYFSPVILEQCWVPSFSPSIFLANLTSKPRSSLPCTLKLYSSSHRFYAALFSIRRMVDSEVYSTSLQGHKQREQVLRPMWLVLAFDSFPLWFPEDYTK